MNRKALTYLISISELLLFLILSLALQSGWIKKSYPVEAGWYLLIVIILLMEAFYLFRTIIFNVGYMSLPLTILSLYYFEVLKKDCAVVNIPNYIFFVFFVILLMRLFSLLLLFKKKENIKNYFDYKVILATIMVDFMSILLFLLN